MASATLQTVGQTWPAGTTVTVFPYVEVQPTLNDPPGMSITSASVGSNGQVTFSGLANDTRYWAVGGSPKRWVQFSTFAETVVGANPDFEVIEAGNLGSSYTVILTGRRNVMLVGTLNANCTLTFTNLVAGAQIVCFLSQDATGGRTLTVDDDESSPISVSVSSTALSVTRVDAICPDGSTLYVSTP